jgi:hypothetical protein
MPAAERATPQFTSLISAAALKAATAVWKKVFMALVPAQAHHVLLAKYFMLVLLVLIVAFFH